MSDTDRFDDPYMPLKLGGVYTRATLRDAIENWSVGPVAPGPAAEPRAIGPIHYCGRCGKPIHNRRTCPGEEF